ncbi:hypothetical protein FACS1894205_2190 [Alphaproteobacteria bacterium]|nr:hypothetical protein FACS1894205_2190 [Alphaproteobacteria bacterium]
MTKDLTASDALDDAQSSFSKAEWLAAKEMNDERDLFNLITGHHQMADAISRMTRVFSLQKLSEIKERKLYRGLKGKLGGADGVTFMNGTWEEFCSYVLDRDRKLVDDDIKDFRTFGEKALEALNRAGIGYRQLRELRKLPDDDRAALIEAAASEDKDSLLELAEDLIARVQEKKKDAEEKLTLTEDALKACERLLTEKNRQLDEIAIRAGEMAAMPLSKLEEKLHKRLLTVKADIQRTINSQFVADFRQLLDIAGEAGTNPRRIIGEVVGALIKNLRDIAAECDVPDTLILGPKIGEPENPLAWADPEEAARGDAEIEAMKPDWMKTQKPGA